MVAPEESPLAELAPSTPAEIAELLRCRFEAGGPALTVVGGGTSLAKRDAAPATRLLTTRLDRIIDYPARDMTITVEAGIRVAELQRVLAREGQRLAIDIPQADQATLGGAIAANASGLGRYGNGTFRDYVLGIHAVDGRGRLFAAGGRVVKNVAGYDLCKLIVGSRGRLAVLTEVTLKLRPLPETRSYVWAPVEDWAQLEAILHGLLTSEARPIAIEWLNAAAAREIAAGADLSIPESPAVVIGVEGTTREAAWQTERLLAETSAPPPCEPMSMTGDQARRLDDALREQTAGWPMERTFEAALHPSRLVECLIKLHRSDWRLRSHAACGLLFGDRGEEAAPWGEDSLDSDFLNETIPHAAGRWTVASPPLHREDVGSAASQLAKRLKAAFDPCGLLNPHLDG